MVPVSSSPSGSPTVDETKMGELTHEAEMFSSRQRALFEKGKEHGITSTIDCNITQISFADIPKLQDFFPNMIPNVNTFKRTRIPLEDMSVPPCSSSSRSSSSSASAVSPAAGATASTAQHPTFKITYSQMIKDGEVVIMDIVRREGGPSTAKGFVRAGPRKDIVWADGEVRAAIVTCGGLCPGLNNVIEEIFNCLYYNYGVDTIYGIKAGFRGFWQKEFQPWEALTPESTKGISSKGGSIIQAARGGFNAEKILNACEVYGVNQVYIIGGDGTHRAAGALQKAALDKKCKLVVACVPKTIDNDIGVIDRSFGFATAVQEATRAINSVVVESKCFPNGVGIVKLMGRHAGYISTHATLASGQVDVCLIPEVKFPLYGRRGLLRHIQRVVKRQGSAVIVVAEGAAYEKLSQSEERDVGGNLKFSNDVGEWLKMEINSYFSRQKLDVSIKYVDPSYMIRAVSADANDSIYCLSLAHNAVHGAMAGYTGFTSALVNNRTVLLPIEVITTTSPSYLNPSGRTWERVVSLTQQPNWGHSNDEKVDLAADILDARKEWDASPEHRLKTKL